MSYEVEEPEWLEETLGRPSSNKPARDHKPQTIATSTRPIDIADAYDLLHRVIPAPVEVIPDLLYTGVTLVTAAPKIGKSMMTLAVLSEFVMERSEESVIYLSLDDSSEYRLQDRLRSILDGRNLDPNRLFYAFSAPSMDDGFIPALDTLIRAHPAVRIVVIDVFAAIKAKNGQEVYKGDWKTTASLRDWAVEHGIAIMLLHHTRKAANHDGDWFNAINGTNGIAGGASAVMYLMRERGCADVIMKIEGRDVLTRSEIRFSMDYLPEIGRSVLHGDDESPVMTAQITSACDQVLAYMKQHSGAASVTQITRDLEFPAASVRKLLTRMVKRGEIVRQWQGHYALTAPTTPAPPILTVMESPTPAPPIERPRMAICRNCHETTMWQPYYGSWICDQCRAYAPGCAPKEMAQ